MAYDAKTKSFKSVDDFPAFSYLTYFDGGSGPYGISSTAQDLFKWNQAIQNNTLLTRQNFMKAISVDTLNNGKSIKMAGLYYGFGWLFTDSTNSESKMHFHSGDILAIKRSTFEILKNKNISSL
ncbi:serine hydrolase [Sphingobacterium sp. E70]|uniref:serine hydrolase n=1 Tax=Sphingobacterium sp. E70 TaxID=2853439 RepID=UPI00211B9760|nr:serine hydrolase [Sphingobacterium sp. E70]ULT27871.1 serine hydrolase [Sphingobacterium sp. E70]